MSLFEKPLASITEEDLASLIGEVEGKTIDFKRDRVGATDGDRKEFLYDVSSFANTAGGDLIFGIAEVDGAASDLVGLSGISADQEIQRLEQMARDGIRPTIAGFSVRAVPISSDRFALVARVPKSWTPPHQVTFQKAFRFYARDTNGKYQIDVDGLRTAFAASGAIGDQLRSFRADRLAKILSDQPPAPLQDGAKVVLHVVPFSAVGSGGTFPLVAAQAEPRLFPTWKDASSRNSTVTFDGLVGSSNLDPPPTAQRAYTLVMRSGAVEAVNNFHQREILPELQAHIIHHALKFARSLDRLGAGAPYAILVSLVGCRGARLVHDFAPHGAIPEDLPCGVLALDQYALIESVWETLPQDGAKAAATLKVTLDHLANAAGLAEAPYFDDAGRCQMKLDRAGT
jgi:hypothetical protein